MIADEDQADELLPPAGPQDTADEDGGGRKPDQPTAGTLEIVYGGGSFQAALTTR